MTDVLHALRDVSLTAEERLKVAAAIARHGNRSLPEDKVTFLAKWACEEICNAYSKKNRQDISTSGHSVVSFMRDNAIRWGYIHYPIISGVPQV